MNPLPGRHLVPFGPEAGCHHTTIHCLEQFRKRASRPGSAGQLLVDLERWVRSARPAELKPAARVKKLLLHNFREARYLMHDANGQEYWLDIHLRMLQPDELSAATGFPTEYRYAGTKTEVTKQIGNAVPPVLANALARAALVA